MSGNIFSLISKENIYNMLFSFHICMGLSVQLLDENYFPLIHFGKETGFCAVFRENEKEKISCEKMYKRAGEMSAEFGGTYIFSCDAGLSNMLYPITVKKKLVATVLVGPFLFDSPEMLFVSDFKQKFGFSQKKIEKLNEFSQNLLTITPSVTNHISNLLKYLLNGVIFDNSLETAKNQEKLYQQAKINEAIQTYKTFGNEVNQNYPFQKEQELILKIKTGDNLDARRVLNELLGYVFFSEGNSLEAVKLRSIELASVLSRATIECGAPTDIILSVNRDYQASLPNFKDIDVVCYELQNVIDAFIDSLFFKSQNENNIHIKKAVSYIAKNYYNKFTLEDVANSVNLSPAYFSTVFKKVTEISFSKYLNNVRVEESKYLLLNTEYSVMDIAIAVGYEDQGYYTKVFKKITGMTPGDYKKWFTGNPRRNAAL